MLKPDLITREELYEAVWTESVQSLAKALGISDVGLAKICKKLHVPRPGRGYWAKSPGARKLLKRPLPPLEADEEETYRVAQAATVGGAEWTRAALKTLAEEGVAVPVISQAPPSGATHPLIARYRGLLEERGLRVEDLLSKKACLAVSVSPAQLDRSLTLLQGIFAAFEAQGLSPEVLPPNPQGLNRWGHAEFQPSRTGVRIKGIFVAFAITEAMDTVEQPTVPPKGRPGFGVGSVPQPTHQRVPSGKLLLEIVDPTPHGMRRRWQEREARPIERELDAFFRAVMAIAEHEHQEALERERARKAEEEAERRKREAEAQRAELAARLFDLESRLMDVQQAQAIRAFAEAVQADGKARGLTSEASSEMEEWVAWARSLAESLEQGGPSDPGDAAQASRGIAEFRVPPGRADRVHAQERRGPLATALHLRPQVTPLALSKLGIESRA